MSMNHLLVVFLALIAALIASPSLAAASGYEFSKWSSSVPRPSCRGSIAECMASGEEFQMDSESNRRILASATTIGYGVLQADYTPCTLKGESYYTNCQSSGQANSYVRTCEAVTKCH